MPPIKLALAFAVALLTAIVVAPPSADAEDGAPEFMPDLPRPPLRTLLRRAPCPDGNCDFPGPYQPAAQGLRVVYLNFDGVTLSASNTNDDARNNVSAILAGSTAPGAKKTVAAFNPNDLWSTGGLSRSQIINRVTQEMYELHSPYNVDFVTQRPTSGNYHMVVFGGSCTSVAGESGCAGIALLDCGDFLPSNIVFVFPGNLRVGDLSTTAAQEGAHAFGLTHTLDTTDVMYPTIQSNFPTRFGSGQVPSSDMACNGSSVQNSHEMMLDTIGFRGQDTIPPAVNITAPAQGSAVAPGSQVTASAMDNAQVMKVEFVVNSVVKETKTSPPFDFTVPADTPAGDGVLSIRAEDDSGNIGSDRVIVYITSGDEQPCDGDGQCPDGLECNNNLCVPDNGVAGELGDICQSNEDCVEGACAMLGDESRCSVPCDAETACPTGFECRGDTACWPPEESGGCNLAGGRSTGRAAWLLGLIAIALVTRRQRRLRTKG